MDFKSEAIEASTEIDTFGEQETRAVPTKTRKRFELQASRIDQNGSKVIKPFSLRKRVFHLDLSNLEESIALTFLEKEIISKRC